MYPSIPAPEAPGLAPLVFLYLAHVYCVAWSGVVAWGWYLAERR